MSVQTRMYVGVITLVFDRILTRLLAENIKDIFNVFIPGTIVSDYF